MSVLRMLRDLLLRRLPGDTLTETEVHDLLMARYDATYAHASEFERGGWSYSVRVVLHDIYAEGLQIERITR